MFQFSQRTCRLFQQSLLSNSRLFFFFLQEPFYKNGESEKGKKTKNVYVLYVEETENNRIPSLTGHFRGDFVKNLYLAGLFIHKMLLQIKFGTERLHFQNLKKRLHFFLSVVLNRQQR